MDSTLCNEEQEGVNKTAVFDCRAQYSCEGVSAAGREERADIPVKGVGQLGWFGQIVEAVDARTWLAHRLAVKTAAVKVGQLLPVVLLVLIWVIMVGTDHVIQGLSVGLLWLGSSKKREIPK